MTPERWRRVEELYHAALKCSERDRSAFLASACAGDDTLRRDVESLLAEQAPVAGFLEGPPAAVAAHIVGDIGSLVFAGQRLGVYQVQARIGTGGMGEVYRARDTKLGRDVALKILPRFFTMDPERLARFKRETHVLASLNHPNIATIHGIEEADDIHALVLELIDGDTLADRLARGSVPLKEVLTIARQLADALDAAHEKGIIHRDLKPANIKITNQGLVKVLDFGLSKAVTGDELGPDLSQLTTATGATREGLILGTPAYMSPEQARGKPVDKRTDIWAFGCVLYEMLAGRAAFARETVSDTIVAILEREPDWTAVSEWTPANARLLVERCLDKDQRRRLRDIGDAPFLLEAGTDVGSSTGAFSQTSAPVWRRSWAWIAGAVVGSLITAFIGRSFRAVSVDQSVVSFTINLGADEYFPADWGTAGSLALSPAGEQIVYRTRRNGVDRLYSRRLDALEARPIAGTEGASGPFFSPDGQWVGFYADGMLKKIPLAGGAPIPICPAAQVTGASWGTNGRIVFGAWGSSLMSVPAEGGTPRPVPGVTERTVFAVPFDPSRREVIGKEVPLQQGVQDQTGSFSTSFAVSSTGTLAYLPRSSDMGTLYRSGDGLKLLSVDVQTEPNVQVGFPRVVFEGRLADVSGGFYADYDVSRDGRQFLVIKADDGSTAQRLGVVVGILKCCSPPKL